MHYVKHFCSFYVNKENIMVKNVDPLINNSLNDG